MKYKKLLPVAVLAAGATSAFAASDSDFEEVFQLLADWSQGSLGKLVSLAAVIVGVGIGIVRQSIMAAVIGIAMAVVVQYAPTIIGNIVSGGGTGG